MAGYAVWRQGVIFEEMVGRGLAVPRDVDKLIANEGWVLLEEKWDWTS